MAADAGPAVDLRDDGDLRSTYLLMLLDWEGTDLRNIYEPITDQIGYIFTAFLLVLVISFVYSRYRKRLHEANDKSYTEYKVLRPPAHVIEGGESRDKRVVAVLGATGFVGSHLVDTLIERGRCHVYMLGRRFTEAKMHPGADAVFQVDMMNYQSLVHAFKGVESVVHSAVSIPTVYSTVEAMWRIHTVGMDNVIAAAKECGVKNLVFISGIKFTSRPKNIIGRTIYNAFDTMDQTVIKANGQDGLSTTIVAFSQIYGIRSPIYDLLLSGKMSRLPLPEHRATFVPVEYAASAVANAEEKLHLQDDRVTGKIFSLTGEKSSFKEFYTSPGWEVKISSMSPWLLRTLAKLNQVTASVLGWAPMGPELSPAICDFFDMAEETMDCTASVEILGLEPVPDAVEGVRKMVEKYKERNA